MALSEDDLTDMEHLLTHLNEANEPESRALLQAKINRGFATLLKEAQHLQDVLRGGRAMQEGEPWTESLTDASLLRLEEMAHADTRRNLGKANKWIAHLERELHARGGPPPRIADIVDAQDGGAASPPSRPPSIRPRVVAETEAYLTERLLGGTPDMAPVRDALEETPEPQSNETLKLFVWEGVLKDYRDGIAFALAHDADEARRLIVAQEYGPGEARDQILSGARSIYDEELQPSIAPELRADPKVFDSPVGFALRGGG